MTLSGISYTLSVINRLNDRLSYRYVRAGLLQSSRARFVLSEFNFNLLRALKV